MQSVDNNFIEENAKFIEYVQITFDSDMKTPTMRQCSYKEAVMETIGQLIPKPFFIYLHDSNTSNHKEFFSQNICNDIVFEYLKNEEWSIWPVDVSDKSVMNKLMSEVRNLVNGDLNRYSIKTPMMIMVVREHINNRIAALMCSDDSMVIVDQLFDQGEMYKCHLEMMIHIIQGKKDQAKFEKQQREIKQQQKIEEIEKMKRDLEEQQRMDNEQELKLQKKKERENIITYAKSQIKETLPSKDNFVFKFRCFNGVTLSKEFSESQTINDVMYFLESEGNVRDEVKVLFSHPVKNLCEVEDVSTSLKNAGISKREMINVQMKK